MLLIASKYVGMYVTMFSWSSRSKRWYCSSCIDSTIIILVAGAKLSLGVEYYEEMKIFLYLSVITVSVVE